ncbi:cell division protein DivIVA [Corynebacterium sp.]|uniref:cell division protein DivIVA n=1 Tax=Corynebacterium sp. TaxID=1720 RepID=UPI002A90EF79|nr:cell division protein DivIVA [Corynebacterium sp.]MDY5784799.1 cell division protein DivIVA [Corynebacterium sp.]
MLSWILLILIIAIVCTIGFVLSARIFGRGEALDPMPPTGETVARNRQAVAEGRFGDVELEVVHRGYRMDQVDALVSQLIEQRRESSRDDNGDREERSGVDLGHSDLHSPRAGDAT